MKMARFGGCAYWDGLAWRCPDCNGLTRFEAGTDVCQTCDRRGDHVAALVNRYRVRVVQP